MMYIPDAIRDTIELVEADADQISIYTSYNISPQEIADEIKKNIPEFIKYESHYHQQIAETWPESINDSVARQDWN